MDVKKLWVTPDPEYQIIRCARICRNSEDKIDSFWSPAGLQKTKTGGLTVNYPVMRVSLGSNDTALLKKMLEHNHGAVLRFASAAVNVSGISRACSHQLVRIAHFGIMQRSQRHVSEEESCAIIPEELGDEFGKKLKDFHDSAKALYTEMVEAGVPKEQARYALPCATQTEVNLVANFQAWCHFLDIRLSKTAQKEIRNVATEILKLLYEEAPIVFDRYKEHLE